MQYCITTELGKLFCGTDVTHCCAEQVDTTEGCPKINLFTFKDDDRLLHIDWSYGVGP